MKYLVRTIAFLSIVLVPVLGNVTAKAVEGGCGTPREERTTEFEFSECRPSTTFPQPVPTTIDPNPVIAPKFPTTTTTQPKPPAVVPAQVVTVRPAFAG